MILSDTRIFFVFKIFQNPFFKKLRSLSPLESLVIHHIMKQFIDQCFGL